MKTRKKQLSNLQKTHKDEQTIHMNKLGQTQAIELGDKLMRTNMNRVDGVLLNINNGNQQIGYMNTELKRQEENMLEVQEEAYEIESILKRSRKLIMEFTHSYYKDKCIRILSILILLLVTVIVVIVFVKKGGGGEEKKVIVIEGIRSGAASGLMGKFLL